MGPIVTRTVLPKLNEAVGENLKTVIKGSLSWTAQVTQWRSSVEFFPAGI